jgi:hypothetical protein
MKAIDTVIYTLPDDDIMVKIIREEQAEISFEAGKREMYNLIDDYFAVNMPMLHMQLNNSITWKNKLKEWFIG